MTYNIWYSFFDKDLLNTGRVVVTEVLTHTVYISQGDIRSLNTCVESFLRSLGTLLQDFKN